MPVFDVGSAAYQGPTTVGTTSSVKVWSDTVSSLAGLPAAVNVRDLIIQNVGTAVIYVSSGTINTGTVAAASLGMPVQSGGYIAVYGWQTTTNTTTNDIYAVAGAGTGASVAVAGLGTLISVV